MKQIDTIVLVESIETSKRFYSDFLGLEILHDWESMVIFKNRLAIHQTDLLLPKLVAEKFLKQGKQGASNIIIYLELENENIEDYYTRMQEKKVEILHDIQKLPWQKKFRIYDPDNHIIEIGEPHKE